MIPKLLEPCDKFLQLCDSKIADIVRDLFFDCHFFSCSESSNDCDSPSDFGGSGLEVENRSISPTVRPRR